MQVYQIPVNRHPAILAVHQYLLTLPPIHASGIVTDSARVWENIDAPKFDQDIDFPKIYHGVRLHRARSQAFQIAKDYGMTTGEAWYLPPMGGIGWHTNASKPNWRAYITRPTGRSFFKTISDTYWDRPGHANVFRVTGITNSWHCVGAYDERWSIGLWLPPELAIDWGLEKDETSRTP